MNENIVKRRQEMVKRRSMGTSLQVVVKELHEEYGVSKTRLYEDYRCRHKWIPYIMDIKDANLAYWDIMASHQQVKDWAILQYLKADNSSAAIGALRLIRDLNLDFADLLITRDVLSRLDHLEAKT